MKVIVSKDNIDKTKYYIFTHYNLEPDEKIFDVDDKYYADCVFEDFDNNGFNVELYNARKEKLILDKLRNQRELECFPIVNRGQLWYDTLTAEQRTELQSFYRAWLDVTETKVIPTKPSWLK